MLFAPRRVRGLLPVLAILAFTAPASAHGFKIGALEIGHPWARETPVSAKTGAGFLTIKNTGTDADRLIAVETSGAEKVEIHESINENGIAKMRPVTAVEIPAGGEAALQPGGYHLMLINLKEPLAEGMRIPGTLVFEKAGKLNVEFTVEGMGYGGPAAKHGDAPATSPAGAEEHKHH
jgi:periplasmic copper chaperone A